jgi:hypothetical protein
VVTAGLSLVTDQPGDTIHKMSWHHPITLMNARTITTTTTASINFIAVSYRLAYAIVLSVIASHGADCAMPTYSTRRTELQ